jgi:hypothetical protein
MKTISKFTFILFVLVTGFFQANSQMPQTGIMIQPATMNFSLNSGQNQTQTIYIINRMDVKKQFTLYLNDWERDTVGGHRYYAPSTLDRSCARWISLEKLNVEVNPGEVIPINVRLHLPDSADAVKEMKWAMLFIETIEEKKAPKVEGVTTVIGNRMRVGVHIYQTPQSVATKDIKMLNFDAKPNSNDSVYRIVCQNAGDIQITCKSYIELSSLEDGKKIAVEPIEFPMFPQQKRFVDFVLPANLRKGKYTVLAAVDGGNDLPLEAAQKIIEVK